MMLVPFRRRDKTIKEILEAEKEQQEKDALWKRLTEFFFGKQGGKS